MAYAFISATVDSTGKVLTVTWAASWEDASETDTAEISINGSSFGYSTSDMSYAGELVLTLDILETTVYAGDTVLLSAPAGWYYDGISEQGTAALSNQAVTNNSEVEAPSADWAIRSSSSAIPIECTGTGTNQLETATVDSTGETLTLVWQPNWSDPVEMLPGAATLTLNGDALTYTTQSAGVVDGHLTVVLAFIGVTVYTEGLVMLSAPTGWYCDPTSLKSNAEIIGHIAINNSAVATVPGPGRGLRVGGTPATSVKLFWGVNNRNFYLRDSSGVEAVSATQRRWRHYDNLKIALSWNGSTGTYTLHVYDPVTGIVESGDIVDVTMGEPQNFTKLVLGSDDGSAVGGGRFGNVRLWNNEALSSADIGDWMATSAPAAEAPPTTTARLAAGTAPAVYGKQGLSDMAQESYILGPTPDDYTFTLLEMVTHGSARSMGAVITRSLPELPTVPLRSAVYTIYGTFHPSIDEDYAWVKLSAGDGTTSPFILRDAEENTTTEESTMRSILVNVQGLYAVRVVLEYAASDLQEGNEYVEYVRVQGTLTTNATASRRG